MKIEGLRFGPIERAVHVCVDMQRLFADETEWASPVVHEIAPVVARICARSPERTIFTRFLTPPRIEEARGQWKTYYRRWSSVLANRLDPDVFALLPELRKFVPPALVVDKYSHSGFENPKLQQALCEHDAKAIIFTGVETDVCVLATALPAIDRGYRTILVSDAIASSNAGGHQACLNCVFTRYDEQVELIDSATLLAAWKP
jgi:nicotinamidase-related amidase